MSEDLKEAFVAAALETFQKLSECPEIKNYRVYREPENNLRRKLQKHEEVVGKSTLAPRSVSSLPFRWVLVVSAQKSAHRAVWKVRGYRQA